MRAKFFLAMLPVLYTGSAWSHDGAATCDSAAAKQPSIEAGRAELKQKPKSVSVRTNLADKLIGISCYDEAVHVLEDGVAISPNDKNLQTRLKTARSFIGERDYLEKRPAAASANDAELARLQLRCKQIGDLQSCDQALANRPKDALLWAAKGDALLKEKRAREALLAFNNAKQFTQGTEVDVTARMNAAQALLATQNPPSIAASKPAPQTPVRTASVATTAPRYSNLEPASRSN